MKNKSVIKKLLSLIFIPNKMGHLSTRYLLVLLASFYSSVVLAQPWEQNEHPWNPGPPDYAAIIITPNPRDFGGGIHDYGDYSWKQIELYTYCIPQNIDRYDYAANIWCRNKSNKPILMQVSYVIRKTKRKLYGRDYPLTGDILDSKNVSFICPPDGYYYGLIPKEEALYWKSSIKHHEAGYEVTSISCSYVK